MNLRNAFIAVGLMAMTGQCYGAETSSSGLFIEPSLTFEQGASTVTYPSPLSNSTGSSTGLGIGAKLGFHISEAFFLALDGRYSMPQYKDSSVNYDAKSVSTNWGPAVGIQMPDLGFRIFGTVVLGGELNPEKSGSFDVAFKKATGYRLGAGFHVAAVSLNLEYQQLKYGESTLEQLGPFNTGTSFSDVTLDNKSWIASVSFPIEL